MEVVMKWTIGRKLNTSFIVIMLLAMGSIAYVSTTGLYSISRKAITIYDIDTIPLVTVKDASHDVNMMAVSINNMLLKDISKLDGEVLSYNSAKDNLYEKIARYEDIMKVDLQSRNQGLLSHSDNAVTKDQSRREFAALANIKKYKDQLQANVTMIISMIKNNQTAAAQEKFFNEVNPQFDQIKESLNVLSDLQLEQMKQSFDEDILMTSGLLIKIVVIIALSLLIGCALFFVLIRGIVNPLQQLLRAANSISTKGDLDQTIKVIHNDETGELAKAFQSMTDYLKEMARISSQIAEGNLAMKVKIRSENDTFGLSFQKMTEYLQEMAAVSTKIAEGDLTQVIEPRSEKDIFGYSFKNMLLGLRKSVSRTLRIAENVSSSSQQLSSSAQQINSTTQEIAATVQQIAKGSQVQAQRVEEVTKIIEQMNTSVDQVANSSKTSADTSVQAANDAEKGSQAVQSAMLKMNKIYETVTRSSKIVKALGERSDQIGEIVSVITNIADQTNLLALNAAIEAARAGEAGRGFAVVAEEVRKLAEGSAKAAEEITVLIKGTQKEAEDAVKAMELGSQEVNEGREIAENAGSALQEIIETVKQTSHSIQLIANSAQKMAISTKEVVKSIDDVAATAEEAASGAEEAGASTEEMSASMQQIAASSQELSDMAMTLQDTVAQFKLGDEEKQTNFDKLMLSNRVHKKSSSKKKL